MFVVFFPFFFFFFFFFFSFLFFSFFLVCLFVFGGLTGNIYVDRYILHCISSCHAPAIADVRSGRNVTLQPTRRTCLLLHIPYILTYLVHAAAVPIRPASPPRVNAAHTHKYVCTHIHI